MASSHRILAIAALLLLTACHRGVPPGVEPAPAAPEAAVSAFLAAVDSGQLARMAALWGTARGPSTVVIRNADERERRLTVMHRLLLHSSYRFVPGPVALTPRQELRTLYVELTLGDRRAVVPFTVVAQRRGGWLVQEIGLDAAMPLANPRRPPTP